MNKLFAGLVALSLIASPALAVVEVVEPVVVAHVSSEPVEAAPVARAAPVEDEDVVPYNPTLSPAMIAAHQNTMTAIDTETSRQKHDHELEFLAVIVIIILAVALIAIFVG